MYQYNYDILKHNIVYWLMIQKTNSIILNKYFDSFDHYKLYIMF